VGQFSTGGVGQFYSGANNLFLFKRRDIDFRHRVGQTALRLGNPLALYRQMAAYEELSAVS
jgi:hypothetical protein